MKKYIFLILWMFMSLTATAQTVGDAFYIYRNDGQFNAFFRDEVDSIVYSHYDVDSLYYAEIITQVVYTQDSIYRIPLAAIDSLGFVQPETKYKEAVMRINEDWLPYVVNVTESQITFLATTPSSLLPSVGQVIITETFEDPFSTGFSGRINHREQTSDGIVFTVDEIGLDDIYDHIVSVGFSSSYNESELQYSRKRIWGKNTDRGVKFPLPNVDVAIGPVTISCKPLVTMKYIVCVGEPNLKNYVDIRVFHHYEGSVKLDCKIDADYKPEPRWPRGFIPITTGIPGLYGKIQFGGFLRASGSVQLSAKQPFIFDGETSFIKAEGEPSQKNNNWTAKMEDTEFSVSIDGSVSTGLAVRLQFGLIHEKIASADVTAYIGPQISGHLGLTSAGIINNTLYSSLKDSEVTLSFGAEIVPGYRFWGSNEHNELPVSINLYWPINHWYVVPEFSNLTYVNHGSSGILNGNVQRNLLPKVSLGWGLFDSNENLFKSEYFPNKYRKIEDWNQNGLELKLEDLPTGRYYKAYPLVKLMGVEMRADQYVEIESVFPIKIEKLDITKATYYPNHYTYNNKQYSFKYNCTTYVTLKDNTDVVDWGYVYIDPEGNVSNPISLKQYSGTVGDPRYAYCRNEANGKIRLQGYVKYKDDDETYYGEVQEFPIEYPAESSVEMKSCTFQGTESNAAYQGKTYKYKSTYRYLFTASGAYWLKVGTEETGSGWNNWNNLPDYTTSPVDGTNALTVNYYYDDKTFTGDYNVYLKATDATHSVTHLTTEYVTYTHSGNQFTGCTYHSESSNARSSSNYVEDYVNEDEYNIILNKPSY